MKIYSAYKRTGIYLTDKTYESFIVKVIFQNNSIPNKASE
jgi:hypothetical protein